MFVYLTCGLNTLKRIIIEGMPNKAKLKQILGTKLKKEKNHEISKKIKFQNENKNINKSINKSKNGTKLKNKKN
jgi:hypothetical protein